MGCSEQHRLCFEQKASLAVLQNRLCYVARLIGFITDADQTGSFNRCPLRPEILGEMLLGQIHDCIGCRKDGLRFATPASSASRAS
jgi:hypothetical protein